MSRLKRKNGLDLPDNRLFYWGDVALGLLAVGAMLALALGWLWAVWN